MSVTVSLDDVWEIADACLHDIEVRDYSGKGMYGDQCVAVVTDCAGLAQFVAQLAHDVYTWSDDEPVSHPLKDFLDRIDTVHEDNMGRGMVYYWPGVKVNEDA